MVSPVLGALHDYGRGANEGGEIGAGYIRVQAIEGRLVLVLEPELYALAVERGVLDPVSQPQQALGDSVVYLSASGSGEGLHARDP